ncbi:MAG: transposase, partial [Puniceicoccaceae bacterium]
TDGAILGSAEFVRSFQRDWQQGRSRPVPAGGHPLKGADWQGLAVVKALRRKVMI